MALKFRLILATLIFLSSCVSSEVTTPVVPPTPIDTPRPIITAAPDDTGWQTLQPGLDYRELRVKMEERSDRLRMARVDPSKLQLRVWYDPHQPRQVSAWLNSTSALLVVNGNYFDPQYQALGLIISEGVTAGRVYEGFGGTLAIGENLVKVRANVVEPYQSGEGLRYALQNFPMLVLPGGQANDGIEDNQQRAPRTAVAQDRSGRIVFVVSPLTLFTLTEFGQWLAASDLDLDAALNLDGGTSSGLLVRGPDRIVGVDSWVNVPSVIAVEVR